MYRYKKAVFFAVLAAALYAINAPISKLLIEYISPTALAGLLYLGAGLGMGTVMSIKKLAGVCADAQYLEKKDMPFTVGMVLLDIIAPILLMYGIKNTNSSNVSLLNNFEIAATSIIALLIFKEKISKRLWSAILLVLAASALLGFDGGEAFVLNKGSLFVLGASACWGLENNCTRSISHKSSEQIVVIKGVFSGLGALAVALASEDTVFKAELIVPAMLLGFAAYGLSIYFYILAQKELGAAKTSAFYSAAPFIGVFFSFIVLKERPPMRFYAAFLIMIAAAVIMIKDTLSEEKIK